MKSLRRTPPPPGDYRHAITTLGTYLHESPQRSPVMREPELRYEAAECFLGLHSERNARDRKLSGVDMFEECADCGLLKIDWDTTHELYRPWSNQCGPCKAEYVADDAAYNRRADI